MEQFGAEIIPKNKFHFPLTLVSSSMPIGIKFDAGISSQIKSAVMLAGINSYGKTTIVEKIKSRDHTEKMFKNCIKIPISIKKENKYEIIKIQGLKNYNGFNYNVPGDISSASFFIVLTIKFNEFVYVLFIHKNILLINSGTGSLPTSCLLYTSPSPRD